MDKLKILIVDDDESTRMLLSHILYFVGHEVFASNGKEAVEIMQTTPDIDLILMDVSMPEMDGITAIRKIREFNKEVVIITQTAYTSETDREKAFQAGTNEFIGKPIDSKELEKLVIKHFQHG